MVDRGVGIRAHPTTQDYWEPQGVECRVPRGLGCGVPRGGGRPFRGRGQVLWGRSRGQRGPLWPNPCRYQNYDRSMLYPARSISEAYFPRMCANPVGLSAQGCRGMNTPFQHSSVANFLLSGWIHQKHSPRFKLELNPRLSQLNPLLCKLNPRLPKLKPRRNSEILKLNPRAGSGGVKGAGRAADSSRPARRGAFSSYTRIRTIFIAYFFSYTILLRVLVVLHGEVPFLHQPSTGNPKPYP